MKTFSLRIAICLVVGFPLYTYADGCEYDTQCKGDRICENGKCTAPAPAAPSSKPADRGWSILGTNAKSETPPANPPYYCCVAHEKLGPYPNDGAEGKIFHAGDTCSGMSRSARHVTGRVCE